ncbi:MAG: helix-turn-helix domain-containing protein [Prevotella sp.]|jgi:transcriptional regulator with XRE-family HTH domain
MNDSAIIQIGQRLKGLREVLDIDVEEMAQTCDMTPEEYRKMENGEGELQVSNLQKIAKKYQVSLEELLFGEEPHNSSYFITRKGKGMSVERNSAYQYQSLAGGFRGRKADPFIVTVWPKEGDQHSKPNSHANQEFNMVMEGSMELVIGNRKLVLNEGDSIYFDSTQPHYMRALNGEKVMFLAIIF